MEPEPPSRRPSPSAAPSPILPEPPARRRAAQPMARLLVWRLVVAVALVAAAVMAAQLALRTVAAQQAMAEDVRKLGQLIAPGLGEALWALDADLTEAHVTALAANPLVGSLRVVDLQRGPLVERSLEPQASGLAGLMREQRFAFPLVARSRSGIVTPVGTLELTTSRAALANRLLSAFSGLVFHSLLLMAGVGLVVFVQLRRLVVLPLGHLADAVERLEPDRPMGRPLPVGLSRAAEIQSVTAVVNHLLERIDRGRAAVDEANRSLEAKVVERTQALEEARLMLERQAAGLARSNRELEQFAFIASHDLREPLRSIGGFLSLLKRRAGPRLSSEEEGFIDFAIAGAGRLDALILGLLDYSMVGRAESAVVRVPLAKVMDDCLDGIRPAIDQCGGSLVLEGPLPDVIGRYTDFVRLFQNLLDNALKFRAPQRPLAVAVRAEVSAGWCSVRISDNGIGFPSDQAQRIFRIFQRLVPPDQVKGCGIGLAICQKVADLYGGRLEVESEPERGATFTVHLPVADGVAVEESSGRC